MWIVNQSGKYPILYSRKIISFHTSILRMILLMQSFWCTTITITGVIVNCIVFTFKLYVVCQTKRQGQWGWVPRHFTRGLFILMRMNLKIHLSIQLQWTKPLPSTIVEALEMIRINSVFLFKLQWYQRLHTKHILIGILIIYSSACRRCHIVRSYSCCRL